MDHAARVSQMENVDDLVEISSVANSATEGGTRTQTGVAPRESMSGFSKKLQPPFPGPCVALGLGGGTNTLGTLDSCEGRKSRFKDRLIAIQVGAIPVRGFECRAARERPQPPA